MKRLIMTLRNYVERSLFLMITLPFLLSVSTLGQASAVDAGIAPEFALFQTESTTEPTEETKEEEEEPDC